LARESRVSINSQPRSEPGQSAEKCRHCKKTKALVVSVQEYDSAQDRKTSSKEIREYDLTSWQASNCQAKYELDFRRNCFERTKKASAQEKFVDEFK
jgi:hypothetical protein